MSAGASHVCMTMGIADRSAITKIVIAENLPIVPRLCPLQEQSIVLGCTCPIMLIIQDELPGPISIGLGLEGEVDGFGFAATDGHFLRLITVRFLPSRDRVLPRRQICKAERPAVTCDGIVRVLHHREIPVHPRMHGNFAVMKNSHYAITGINS